MLDEIFMQIVKMSFMASIVIVVVLVARILLKKAPKIFSYALWSVVLIRLVCPFSIKSILSLIPKKADNISQQIVTSTTPHRVAPAPPIINSPQPSIDTTIPQTTVVTNTGIDWIFVIEILWIIGILAMLLYSVVSLVKLQKSLKYSLNYRENIYLAKNLKSPFVMGVFRPKIYLPDNLTEDEKEYIILHEQMHIKRFDYIIKIISFLILCLHWFNPLVWVAFFMSSKDMEMSCDESVIKKLGNDVKKDYSTSLLSLATGKRIIGGTPLAFGEGQTKSRIKNILSYKQPRFWVVLVCLLAVIAVCVGLMTNPKEKETIFNNDSLVNAEIIDIDSEHKTLMIKGIEKADENSLSGDRCYLSCDEATIYKDNEEVDFSRLKIGNKIACEITEVLESYPTQADTKIIKITDDNFTQPLFKVDTSMLNSLDSLENVSAFAFTEYTKYLNSQKEDEVDKEDFNLTSKKLISGDIRDFVYEYEYTHTRPIDSSLPKQSKVQLHIVNINGNGIQYYVMSADGDIENELNDESQTNITQYTDSEILCEDIESKLNKKTNEQKFTESFDFKKLDNGIKPAELEDQVILTKETANEFIRQTLSTFKLNSDNTVSFTLPKALPTDESEKTKLYISSSATFSPEPGTSSVQEILDMRSNWHGGESYIEKLDVSKGKLTRIFLRIAFMTTEGENSYREYAADYIEFTEPFKFDTPVSVTDRSVEISDMGTDSVLIYTMQDGDSFKVTLSLPKGVTLSTSENYPEYTSNSDYEMPTVVVVKDTIPIGTLTLSGFGTSNKEDLIQIDTAKNTLPMQIFAPVALSNHVQYENYKVCKSSATGANATAKYLRQDLTNYGGKAPDAPWLESDCILAYDYEKAPFFINLNLIDDSLSITELENLSKSISIYIP